MLFLCANVLSKLSGSFEIISAYCVSIHLPTIYPFLKRLMKEIAFIKHGLSYLGQIVNIPLFCCHFRASSTVVLTTMGAESPSMADLSSNNGEESPQRAKKGGGAKRKSR